MSVITRTIAMCGFTDDILSLFIINVLTVPACVWHLNKLYSEVRSLRICMCVYGYGMGVTVFRVCSSWWKFVLCHVYWSIWRKAILLNWSCQKRTRLKSWQCLVCSINGSKGIYTKEVYMPLMLAVSIVSYL